MREDLKNRVIEKLATGPKPAKELAFTLGTSQPTISRALSELGDQVVTLGKGRATRYARPRLVRGMTSLFPIYCIDEVGDIHLLGTLQTLAGGQYWWQPKDNGSDSRIFNYLPWFVQDMRPEGFGGRFFAQKQGEVLGLSGQLQNWTDDDVLIALSRRGEDHIGNLIIGDESMERYLKSTQKQQRGVTEYNRPPMYATLIREALHGDPAGSSAGGEQPKFAVMIEDGDELRHALVKFSPPIDSLEGQRWGDLLVCEHRALEIVQAAGIAAAKSRILESDNRLVLEVDRFDRVGRLGRASIFSLRSIDSEYTGVGDDWAKCALGLLREGIISATDAKNIRWLKVFGSLIGNTDMHLGNLSFTRVSSRFYSLAPVYDMLPMLYRPTSGETPQREFTPGGLTRDTADVWESALQSALHFWDSTASEPGLSDEFKKVCLQNLDVLSRLEAGPRIIL